MISRRSQQYKMGPNFNDTQLETKGNHRVRRDTNFWTPPVASANSQKNGLHKSAFNRAGSSTSTSRQCRSRDANCNRNNNNNLNLNFQTACTINPGSANQEVETVLVEESTHDEQNNVRLRSTSNFRMGVPVMTSTPTCPAPSAYPKRDYSVERKLEQNNKGEMEDEPIYCEISSPLKKMPPYPSMKPTNTNLRRNHLNHNHQHYQNNTQRRQERYMKRQAGDFSNMKINNDNHGFSEQNPSAYAPIPVQQPVNQRTGLGRRAVTQLDMNPRPGGGTRRDFGYLLPSQQINNQLPDNPSRLSRRQISNRDLSNFGAHPTSSNYDFSLHPLGNARKENFGNAYGFQQQVTIAEILWPNLAYCSFAAYFGFLLIC